MIKKWLDALGLVGGSLTALVILHQFGLTWWRVRILWKEYAHRHKIDGGD